VLDFPLFQTLLCKNVFQHEDIISHVRFVQNDVAIQLEKYRLKYLTASITLEAVNSQDH